jgi:hypothetical protein
MNDRSLGSVTIHVKTLSKTRNFQAAEFGTRLAIPKAAVEVSSPVDLFKKFAESE